MATSSENLAIIKERPRLANAYRIGNVSSPNSFFGNGEIWTKV